ncbi:NPC intracellular cholesterol transporter 1 [Chionoecetes opilio]|uniref:NPC intracellular cholesterol transporter 1 n=1 Tax=Chionoecetes opilio TaxID=41210 RepID=A0A8J4Y5Y9_CHIOP|nr:NPC intracellular cholesterol transporter 1 [Chionoecetes opilio]
MGDADAQPRPTTCIQRLSYAVVNTLERIFYRYGHSVASHPSRYIVVILLLTGLSCLGFLNFKIEGRSEKLWIPQNSDYVKTLEWQKQNFPQDQRIEMILYSAENILTADHVREMYQIHERLAAIEITNSKGQHFNFSDLCVRVPALGGKQRDELLRLKEAMFPGHHLSTELDWSLMVDKTTYNEFYRIMPTACLEISLLEMWGYNATRLAALADHDVIHAINTVTLSATFSYPMKFTELLGGVTRNASGHVVGARTALTFLMMQVTRSRIDHADITNQAGLGEEADPEVMAWEGEYIAYLKNVNVTGDLEVYFQAQRSFGEISEKTIFGDVFFLVCGNVILFMYVQLMLGKFNMVENRPVLSILGMLTTYMAVAMAFGLCSAAGLLYGPIHNILPLLMIGLGVDDMFVIVQCWQNLDHQERQLKLRQRMGQALRHAGVAITVTSMTDCAAFLIGATTVLPALRSFCIYAAVSVLTLYVFQATFFVAWFTYDQRRVEDKRNGLFWCYKHRDWQPNKCSQGDLATHFFDKVYSKVLLMKPTKVLVFLVTAAMLGVSIWGVMNLKQSFNPILFIPHSSYLFQFLSRLFNFYPQTGERGTVYFGALNYPQELHKIGALAEALERSEDVASVTSWYDLMVDYTQKDTGEDIRGKELNETFFQQALSSFLFSPAGTRFQTYFHFDGNLTIARPTPTVTACKFDYQHNTIEGREEQIAAMEEVKRLVKEAQFSDVAAATSFVYSSWETNKVIMEELVRNLCLAMVAVFIMTLVLLANIVAACFVFLCVALTLVNVMALMTWWGLTIDIITCINVVLSIGLCVDYSAHVALHFMQAGQVTPVSRPPPPSSVLSGCCRVGTQSKVSVCGAPIPLLLPSGFRMTGQCALREIGPPVINGAFSTFLSFFLLAYSDSHVFLSFFKASYHMLVAVALLCLGVCSLRVFHGLVFLPVLLSVLGPPAYLKPHHLPGGERGEGQEDTSRAWMKPHPLERRESIAITAQVTDYGITRCSSLSTTILNVMPT